MSSNLFYNRILDVLIKNVDNDLTLEKIGRIITRFTIDKEDYSKSEELSLKIFLEYFNKYKDFIDTKCFLPTTNIEISKEDVAYLIKSVIDEYDVKKNKVIFDKSIAEARKTKKIDEETIDEEAQKLLKDTIVKTCINGYDRLGEEYKKIHEENADLINKTIECIFGERDLEDHDDFNIYLSSIKQLKTSVSTSLGKLIEFGILRDFISKRYSILDNNLNDLSDEEAYRHLAQQMTHTEIIDFIKTKTGNKILYDDDSFYQIYDKIIDKGEKNYADLYEEKTNAINLNEVLDANFNILNYKFNTITTEIDDDKNEISKEKVYTHLETLQIHNEKNDLIDISNIEEIIFTGLENSLILPKNLNSIFDFYIPAKVKYRNTEQTEYKEGIIKKFLALESKFSTTNRIYQAKLTTSKTQDLIMKNSQIIYAVETTNVSRSASLKYMTKNLIQVDINFKPFYIKDLAEKNGYFHDTKGISDSHRLEDKKIYISDDSPDRFIAYYAFLAICSNLKMGNIFTKINTYLTANKKTISVTNHNTYRNVNAGISNDLVAYEYINPSFLSSLLLMVDDDILEKINNTGFGKEIAGPTRASVRQAAIIHSNFTTKRKNTFYEADFIVACKYIKGVINADFVRKYITESTAIRFTSSPKNGVSIMNREYYTSVYYKTTTILKFIYFILCIRDNITNGTFFTNKEFIRKMPEDFKKKVKSILNELYESRRDLYALDNDDFLNAVFVNNEKLTWHQKNLSMIKFLRTTFGTGEIIVDTKDYNYDAYEIARLENKGFAYDYDLLHSVNYHADDRFHKIIKRRGGGVEVNTSDFKEAFRNKVRYAYEKDGGYAGVDNFSRQYIDDREGILTDVCAAIGFDLSSLSEIPRHNLLSSTFEDKRPESQRKT